MPTRLAIDIYKEYYVSLYEFTRTFTYCHNSEGIKSLFAELEKSDIPDWAKQNFVDFILNHPPNFYSDFFSNFNIMTKHNPKEISENWLKEQAEGADKFDIIMSKVKERISLKKEGINFDDEIKYEGVQHILERYRNGEICGKYLCNLSFTKNYELIKLYKNYVTEGREFNDEKEVLEQMLIQKLETWKKVESIHTQNNNINKIIEIFNDCQDLEIICEDYSKLPDDLKINKYIYNCIKNKILIAKDLDNIEMYHSLTFFKNYGEICAKIKEKKIIDNAVAEIENLTSINLDFAYQILYSLFKQKSIDFETYLNLYKLFNKNIKLQGALLEDYLKVKNDLVAEYELIKLLAVSDDECIKQNWRKVVNSNFFPQTLYFYLLNRGINKESLDQLQDMYNAYLKEEKKKEKRKKVLSIFKNNK